MNNHTDQIINTPVASNAWLALVIIIAIVATIGIVGGPTTTATATAMLATTGTCLGLAAAFAALKGKGKTANILAITAALSAVATLLVKETQTLQDFVENPDSAAAIFAVVIVAVILLATAVSLCNRENHEPNGQHDQTSPVTTTSKEEPDA